MKKPRFSKLVFFLTLLFLFMPLFVLVAYSFNSSKTMHWGGLSLVWFKNLFTNSRLLWRAFWNSILIALTSAATATVIGTLGAIGINWYSFKLKKYVQAVSLLPLILPEIIIGVSMLIFFVGVKLEFGLLRIYIAHTTFNLPFALLILMSRLDEFDFSIIEAARDLGAKERETLFRVIIPIAMPGIISAFLIAVTMSLEDFVITSFVSGPGSSTLPVHIYSMIRTGVSPVVNALSVVLLFGTVGLVFLMRPFLKYIAHE
ncbi:MAG: ABC transporter permease [Spirochaetales bacterium]|jgi:spermidine/putrescine transport system permease protein|nr:ABC transporter permease [Spirochaetales bacterium]